MHLTTCVGWEGCGGRGEGDVKHVFITTVDIGNHSTAELI